MSASPEFYKPSSAPAFSPPLLLATAGEGAEEHCCRTPTGAGMISYLQEPRTCPPAPRKPRPPPASCRKRLFDVVTLRLDDLERLFRPCPPQPPRRDKRRRSPDDKTARPTTTTTHDELN